MTLETDKIGTSMLVQLRLRGLKGVTIKAPDVFIEIVGQEEYVKFINNMLMALRKGLEETDGTIKKGKAAMGTSQPWQVIVWSLLYFGRIHMHVNAVNVNEGA